MADTAFTIKVGDRAYTLDRFTMGDWRLLKTEFGLNSSDIVSSVPNPETGEPMEVLNLDDPNVLVGLMVLAARRERPKAPVASLIAEVEDLDMADLAFPTTDEDEPETDPTPAEAGASGETDAPAKPGSSGKRPKKPGTRA